LIVEAVRIEPFQRELPQREGSDPLALVVVVLVEGCGWILEPSAFVHQRHQGLGRHSQSGHHAPGVVQHPLQREVAIHRQPARVAFNL